MFTKRMFDKKKSLVIYLTSRETIAKDRKYKMCCFFFFPQDQGEMKNKEEEKTKTTAQISDTRKSNLWAKPRLTQMVLKQLRKKDFTVL